MHEAKLDETIDILQGIVNENKITNIPYVHMGIILDSIHLLKEYQKKQTPVEMEFEGGGLTWWHVCPECHGICDRSDHFCRHCGQAIK